MFKVLKIEYLKACHLNWIKFNGSNTTHFIAANQSTPIQSTIYQLELLLQYSNSTIQFIGHLTFDFVSPKDNQFISLAISNLYLNSLKIYNDLGNLIVISSVKVTENEWKIRTVDWFLANQIYKVEIDYFGQKDDGFFETKYKGKNGEDRFVFVKIEYFFMMVNLKV